MARYRDLTAAGRVAFTTFHQSYGYEEFIEGIKPIVDSEKKDIGYTIEPGLFKSFCTTARKKTVIAKPSRYDQIGNKKVNTAVFYSATKNSVNYGELYECFMSVCEEVMKLGLK